MAFEYLMAKFMEFLRNLSHGVVPTPILDANIPTSEYCHIDLSVTNKELDLFDITEVESCQEYIDLMLSRKNAKVGYGGYLEKRNLYGSSERFHGEVPRNIHLGMDFWCNAGTSVLAPLNGSVHSFANNSDFGNYGPTIILSHEVGIHTFYTLYGHLSLESLTELYEGKVFNKGDTLAALGTPDINVGYAPHLHFQILLEIGEYYGDYPGVCSKNDLEYYGHNCPNPNLLLGYAL